VGLRYVVLILASRLALPLKRVLFSWELLSLNINPVDELGIVGNYIGWWLRWVYLWFVRWRNSYKGGLGDLVWVANSVVAPTELPQRKFAQRSCLAAKLLIWTISPLRIGYFVGELTLVVDWLVLWSFPWRNSTRGDWGFCRSCKLRCGPNGVAPRELSSWRKVYSLGCRRLFFTIKILIYRASPIMDWPSFFSSSWMSVKAIFLAGFRF